MPHTLRDWPRVKTKYVNAGRRGLATRTLFRCTCDRLYKSVRRESVQQNDTWRVLNPTSSLTVEDDKRKYCLACMCVHPHQVMKWLEAVLQ